MSKDEAVFPYDLGEPPDGFRNLIPRHSPDLATWLRTVIGMRLALARNVVSVQADVEDGAVTVPAEPAAASPRWHEQSSGVLCTSEGREDDAWYGTWAMGDSRLTRFIADNDPGSVIARCEAELAILDEHAPVKAGHGPKKDHLCCSACVSVSDDAYLAIRSPCRTVRLLASGYKHRPGYREEWKA